MAQVTGADCYALIDVGKKNFSVYDASALCGALHAGSVGKLNWFSTRMANVRVKADCVLRRRNPADSLEAAGMLTNLNSAWGTSCVRVFYCLGGMNYEQMSLVSKALMFLFFKLVASKKEKTESDREMLKMISHSYDLSNRTYIQPVLDVLNE